MQTARLPKALMYNVREGVVQLLREGWQTLQIA